MSTHRDADDRTSGAQGPRGGISEELRPYVDRAEAEEVDRVGEWLRAHQPVPRAGFRAELGARLSALADRERRPRPRRLRVMVAAYMGSGLALMAVAAIGLAGAGPFAA